MVGRFLLILASFWWPIYGELSTGITDIYLGVSSLVDGGDRRLELNWRGSDPDALIALYDDPPHPNKSPVLHVKANNVGYFRTQVQFPAIPKLNLSGECLGFWIAVVKEEVVLSSRCLRGHPHWMYESRAALSNLSLVDLMLPGSHNAGSYSRYDPREDNVFSRYLYTQEESIFNQLVFGIRYLDLRVGYHTTRNSPENLWIAHSNFRTNTTLKDVVLQVKEFLQQTREIVIMDFHRFVTGFKGRRAVRRHRDLRTLLETELGEFLIPVSYTSRATLGYLWSTNKRLYVGYAEKKMRTPYLFPAVKHLWGDVDDVDDLWSYLNDTVCENSGTRLSSAMVQLTPTATGALFNTYGGLRKMAHVVNCQVTEWFSGMWRECANIISTDFVLGNGIIELAIATNNNKSQTDLNIS